MAGSDSAVERTPRDPFFDNARFLAVVLVVVGHTVTTFPPNGATQPAVLLLQTFRMPLLIIITGYLARNFTFSDEKVRGLVTRLVLPYVTFEVLYSAYQCHISGRGLNLNLLLPTYLMWFLLSATLWRLTVPFWRRVRWPLAVAVALTIVSYTHRLPDELTLRRLFSLLPFFVLGVCLRRRHFEALKRRGMPILGVLLLAGAAAFYYTGGRHVPAYWVYWDKSYKLLGVGLAAGALIQLSVLLLATTLAAAVLTLVPRRRHWFTALGTRTMYAYLLHGFAPLTLVHLGVNNWPFLSTAPGILTSAALAVIVATLLCTAPVAAATRPLIEPRADWLFRRARPDPVRTSPP